jgi:hypothetical protein
MNAHYDLSLPYLRAFIGLVLIFLSLYASIGFLSQGFEGLAFNPQIKFHSVHSRIFTNL